MSCGPETDVRQEAELEERTCQSLGHGGSCFASYRGHFNPPRLSGYTALVAICFEIPAQRPPPPQAMHPNAAGNEKARSGSYEIGENLTEKRGLGILFDTFWTSKGWKAEPRTSEEDFALARDSGYMFDPKSLDHDDVVKWLLASARRATREDIADAFMASLSSRRLDWRSALGSYAFARNFPDHEFAVDARYSFSSRLCVICGLYAERKEIDLNVMNFERHKWGGVRHDVPTYAAFDLDQFSSIERTKPLGRDRQILDGILNASEDLAPEARVADLEKSLTGRFRSNKWERRVVIEILGICGILQPDGHRSYFEEFPTFAERETDYPPVHRIDWRYPVCWWRGRDRTDHRAVSHYFGRA